MKFITFVKCFSALSVLLTGCTNSTSNGSRVAYYPSEKPILSGDNSEYELISLPKIFHPKFLYERGIEGYAIVSFTINKDGTTSNHEIIESERGDDIGPSVISNLSKHLYKPRVVNGEAVSVDGVRQMMTVCVNERINEPNFVFENRSEHCESRRTP